MPIQHVGLALIVCAVWGFNFVAIHYGLLHYPPILMASLRFLAIAWLALFIARPTAWRHLLCVGLTTGTLQFMFTFSAIFQGAPIGLTSLVLQVQVFFTAIFARILLKERIKTGQWLGMMLGFSGILVIAMARQSGTMPLFALGLLMLGAMSWSTGNIFMKIMGPAPVIPFLVWMSVIPPIPLFLFSLYWEGAPAVYAALSEFVWIPFWALLYIAVASTLIGYGLWNWLLAKHPASIVAPYSLLVPVFGMSSGVIFLNEKISSLEWAGAIVVLVGLLVNVFGDGLVRSFWLTRSKRQR